MYFNQAPVMRVGGGGIFGGGRWCRSKRPCRRQHDTECGAAGSRRRSWLRVVRLRMRRARGWWWGVVVLPRHPHQRRREPLRVPPPNSRRPRAAAAAAVEEAAAVAVDLAGACHVNPRRVLLSFPTSPNDLLLSGLLVGGAFSPAARY